MALDEIRKQIDVVDARIRELFIERMKLAELVAVEKAKTEDAIYKPDREQAILDKQSRGMDIHLLMEYRALVRRIMEVSRKYQYGRTLELRDCFPFRYETEPAKVRTTAMLRGELYLCDFCSKDTVRTAGSYDQIAEWIREGTADEGAGVIELVGTGVSDELNTTLLRNGLYIYESKVTEHDGGRYKMVRFSRRLTVLPGHNRLRVALVCSNKSGALASILSMIADYGVNLTEIHSIPFNTSDDWNYRFFLEMEASMLAKEIQALLYQLSQETVSLQLLGSYYCEGDFL